MNTKMYVGNLSYNITEAELRDLFSQYGQVTDAAVILDRETNRPRGFAFVTMSDKSEMDAAIEGLNGYEMDGRALTVNEARPREERSSFRGGGGGGGGGGGRGGYGGGGGGGGRGRSGGGGGGRGRY